MRTWSLLLVCLLTGACVTQESNDKGDTSPVEEESPAGPLGITSSAFEPEGEIPTKHTCDGENVSPALAFAGVAANASTLALIMDDPDAPSGTVLHWTFWNVPANQTQLPEAVDISSLGGREGQAFRGPCPPDGEHRYFFYAYTVAGELELPAGATVDELRAALDGRSLQEAQMYGTYCRPQAPAVGCVVPVIGG